MLSSEEDDEDLSGVLFFWVGISVGSIDGEIDGVVVGLTVVGDAVGCVVSSAYGGPGSISRVG